MDYSKMRKKNSLDYSLIDNLIFRILYSRMDPSEEEQLLWLVILRTILMECPKLETSYKRSLEDISSGVIDIISRRGRHGTPSIELMDFMWNCHFGVLNKSSFILGEPLFADNYPKTDPLGFYDHLLQNMEEFALMEEFVSIEEEDKQQKKAKTKKGKQQKKKKKVEKQQSPDLYNSVFNYFFKKIESELQEFRPYFKAVSDKRKEGLDNNDIKSVITWITYLVYEVEYVLDLLQSKQYRCYHIALWLARVLHRLPDYGSKDRVNRIIGGIPSMEVASKESIINYVVSTNDHQIIPILNYTDEDIGEKLRQIFIDKKIVSTFDVCKWSLAGLPNSPRLMDLYLTVLRQASHFACENYSKVVKEYSTILSLEEFKELVEELLAWWPKYFVIFENVTSQIEFELLKRLIGKSSSSPASKIVYTTREAEVASKCRLNSPKIFYIPSEKSYNTPDVRIDREVVGFIKEKTEMLDRLTFGNVARCVISISGMPGLGKTTLAKLVYKHPTVTQYFHVRAFCTVSQVYKLRELLLQLVHHFCQANDTLHGLQDIELAATIYKSLKWQRYLIVLDDICDVDAWKAIMNCFPDDKNGSRIIITTRQTELMPSNRQPVNLLSEVECWELLEKELFQGRTCPEELITSGKTIARNCKGLPFSVILIAGFLKKLDRTKVAWKKIAETLTSALDVDAAAQRKGIMELSYKHLPDCLQPCFLYFGIFPEDDKIPAEKLICLWSAEGFLLQKVGDDTKRVEDVASNYLEELAGRSLVTIAEKDLCGRVKSYQVHDLIREFCMTKAQEERFFLRLGGYGDLSAYSNSLIDNSLEDPIPFGPRRLVINCERKQFVETKLSALPLVRSMLFLADKTDKFPNNIYDVSFIYDYLKLLKILDLEDVTIKDSSLPLIFKLVLLKYLAIQSDADRIPGELSKLWNLETLIFKSLKANKVILVPDSFWDMTKLRHVHISGKPDFDLDPKRVEYTSREVPNNLHAFSTPTLSTGGKLEKVLPRLQSIRKLKCRFSDQSLDVAVNRRLFPVLDFLSNLDSLKVVYNMDRNLKFTSGEFKFPKYLKKLSLSNFYMPWKEISQLTKLKVLEVLKIQNRAFKGEIWDMSGQNEAFEKLKVLKLDELDIVNWCGVNEDHFPKLKHLLLWNLEKLEEIPEGIGDINTLEMIDVKWCSSSAEESAKDIKEECEEYGKEIKISILSKAREMGAGLDGELESATDSVSQLAIG